MTKIYGILDKDNFKAYNTDKNVFRKPLNHLKYACDSTNLKKNFTKCHYKTTKILEEEKI